MTPHRKAAVIEPPGVPEARSHQVATRPPRSSERGPLGNTTKQPSRTPEQAARRDARYKLRDSLRNLTTLRRVARCGGHRIDKERPPVLRIKGETGARVGYYSGVQLCGSIHACPVCSPRIRQARADDLETAAAAWLKLHGEGSLMLLTLTMPHDHGEALGDLLASIRHSFGALVSGRAWQADRATNGIAYYVVSHDATVGPRGWHPHLHILLFGTMKLSDLNLAALAGRLYDRWARAITRRGHRPPSREHGLQLELARTRTDVARYVCQVVAGDPTDDTRARPVALEMARGDLKTARHGGHRTPWQVLADLAERRAKDDWTPADDLADDRDLALWHEWENTTKGVRAIRWSKGLRQAVGLSEEEKSDDEIVAEEQGGIALYEFSDRDEWRALCETPGARARLVTIAETHGIIGVRHEVARVLAAWRAKQDRIAKQVAADDKRRRGGGTSKNLDPVRPHRVRQSGR